MKADNRPPQKTAGYLEKRGKLKFMNSWKKYWFVLEGHLLLYYGSKDDYDGLSPCKGSISLGHTSTVKPYSPVPLGFQITIRSSTITLRAESVAEQTKWMQAFVTALNPNQNTNESPTKLNHFRYSAENLNMLAENREDVHGTPNSSPRGNSPQHTPKVREAPLIDRLQKLGARSYGTNTSVQNQILEGVRNSRQRSFVKETVAEHNRKEDIDGRESNDLKTVQLSPTKILPRIGGNTSHENRDYGMKKEDVILEDDDFCVCTLGKEENGGDDNAPAKKEVKIEVEKSFSFKSDVLRQELTSEFKRRRKPSDSKKPVTPCLETDIKTIDSQSNEIRPSESFNSSYTKINYIVKNSSNEEPQKKLNVNSQASKQHELPKPPTNLGVHENVDVKQEFYLHGEPNPEPPSENNEITKTFRAKPVRKVKNIQNLFSESKEKRNFEDVRTNPNPELNHSYTSDGKSHNEHVKTKSELKHHSYGQPDEETAAFNSCNTSSKANVESNKERTLKNNPNLQAVQENVPSTNIVYKNNSNSIEIPRDKHPFMKQLQRKSDDVELYMNKESQNGTLAKNDSEASVYTEVNKGRNLKNNVRYHSESDDDPAKSSTKNNHWKTKEEMNNLIMSMERSLDKHNLIKPLKSKNDVELQFNVAAKNVPSMESGSEIAAPVYAEVNKERKLKHRSNLQVEPEDDLVTSSAKNNQSISKGTAYNLISSVEQQRDKCYFTKPIPTKTDLNVHLHTEAKIGTAMKRDSANALESNKEQKLRHSMQIHHHPKHELSNSNENSSCTESRDQLAPKEISAGTSPTYAQPNKERKLKNIPSSHVASKDEISVTKGHHIEAKRTVNNPQLLHIAEKPQNEHMNEQLVNLKEERNSRGISTLNSRTVENIYAEPEDIDTISAKHDMKCHATIKSNQTLFTKLSDKPSPFCMDFINEKKLKHTGNSQPDYHMTDNVLYAPLNNEYNKPRNSGQNLLVENKESLRTEELQCEMDFDEEEVYEYLCANDLYGSLDDSLNTPSGLSTSSNDKVQNDAFPSTWKRQFQFPPPPTDDAPIYAEPNIPVLENVRGSNDDKFFNQNAEYEMENELYATSNTQKNNYEYPEYEEPEIICNDADYNSNIAQANLNQTELVEYSSIPEMDENADHYYSRPFKTNDDFHLYEDPEKWHIQTKQEKSESVKPKKRNGRQKSEPFAKIDRTEETKKGDHFIQKIFKQGARKHTEKNDKCGNPSINGNMDDTLVMLTEIQQLLEKKKRIIKAMSLQRRETEPPRTHAKSKSADLDSKCRSKSYPPRSPDLLKDLNEHIIGCRGLEDEYATVCDAVNKEGEDIYCEVVRDTKFERKEKGGVGKFDTWAHGKVSDND